MNPMHKKTLILSIPMILAVLLLGWWLLLREQRSLQNTERPTVSDSWLAQKQAQQLDEKSQLEALASQVERIPIPRVDTATWQVYKSGIPGIEFKYPSGWEVKANLSKNSYCVKTRDDRYAKIPSSSAQILQGDECIFQIDIDTENSQGEQKVIDSLQLVQKQFPKGKMNVIQGSSFGNLFIFEDSSETRVYTGSNTITLMLKLWNMDKKFDGVPDAFYGILSTLKPIQGSVTGCKSLGNGEEAKKWKVYTNNTSNFSLKYPTDWKYKEGTSVDSTGSLVKTVSFYKPDMKCSIEASPALCGVTVSISPIKSNENSPNEKYLKILEKANTATAPILMEKICSPNLNITEITDYLRHEFVFDYKGYSYLLGSENFGSDNVNRPVDIKEFWSTLDTMVETLSVQ